MKTLRIVKSVALTESDDAGDNLAPFDEIYVGGTGNLVVIQENGASVTFTAVPTGTFVPVRGVRIPTSNAATNLVANYYAPVL